MHVSPRALGQVGPSQYFTLDATCYYGCLATGAGNCEEICQTPAFQVGTTAERPRPSNLQWWILGGFAVVALVVMTS